MDIKGHWLGIDHLCISLGSALIDLLVPACSFLFALLDRSIPGSCSCNGFRWRVTGLGRRAHHRELRLSGGGDQVHRRRRVRLDHHRRLHHLGQRQEVQSRRHSRVQVRRRGAHGGRGERGGLRRLLLQQRAEHRQRRQHDGDAQDRRQALLHLRRGGPLQQRYEARRGRGQGGGRPGAGAGPGRVRGHHPGHPRHHAVDEDPLELRRRHAQDQEPGHGHLAAGQEVHHHLRRVRAHRRGVGRIGPCWARGRAPRQGLGPLGWPGWRQCCVCC